MAAGPVSRILSALRRDGHSSGRALLRSSSDLPGGCDAPSRHVFQPKPELPPYLVLLRVGLALPAALLQRRCALTAPFHPYPAVVLRPRGLTRQAGTIRDPSDAQRRRGGMFSVALSVDRA